MEALFQERALSVAVKVITQHFLYFENNQATGKSKLKCEQCIQMAQRRRFKTAPKKLQLLIEKQLLAEQNSCINFTTPEYLEIGGDVSNKLEKMGEDAIHMWINNMTRVGYSQNRVYPGCRSYYDPFANVIKREDI